MEIRRRLAYVSENKDLFDSMTVDGIMMSAERYFSEAALPWCRLAANTRAAFVVLYASVLSVERRDF